MEEQNIPKTKNKRKIIVLIILLLLVVLMVIAIVSYTNYEKEKVKRNQPTPPTTKEEEKTASDAKEEEKEQEETTIEYETEEEKYLDYISPISVNSPSPLIYNKNHIVANSLTPKEKIEYIGKHLYPKNTYFAEKQLSGIREKDVKREIERIYGPNSYKQADKFTLGCNKFTYDKDDKVYYANLNCGGTSALQVTNLIIDSKKTENKYEITIAYAFLENELIYKNLDKTIILDDYNGGSISDVFMKEYIRINKDTLYHITYVFESTDGRNYYFKEFTNTKQ